MSKFYNKLKVSDNLYNLCVELEKQFHWEADPSTFRRTYAGSVLKGGGAFSWTMNVKNIGNGYVFELGSQEPLSAFSKKGVKIIVDTTWGDTALWAESPGCREISRSQVALD